MAQSKSSNAAFRLPCRSMYASTVFGYQQWYLFDDMWAAAHPDLAASLLRYATSWNPYA